MLQKENIPTDDYPYNPDNSALHHILDEGWIWMLRFNDNRTSFGFVLDDTNAFYGNLPTDKIWNNLLEKYPSINSIIKDTSLATVPGKILRSERLQRKIKHCFGTGWVALPHTVGFVDPLFSSGIAHSLSGIEKVISCISQNWGNEELLVQDLKEYEKAVFEELKITDCLVAGCYKTMPYFDLFNAWSMLYFAATIAHEQRRIKHESPGYFLNADDQAIREMVQKSYTDL
jgi:FADH2 O2-dependent halogenase